MIQWRKGEEGEGGGIHGSRREGEEKGGCNLATESLGHSLLIIVKMVVSDIRKHN